MPMMSNSNNCFAQEGIPLNQWLTVWEYIVPLIFVMNINGTASPEIHVPEAKRGKLAVVSTYWVNFSPCLFILVGAATENDYSICTMIIFEIRTGLSWCWLLRPKLLIVSLGVTYKVGTCSSRREFSIVGALWNIQFGF